MPSYDRALHALRSWLDSWSGIGRIALGMGHQGFDLHLTRYDDRGWRATFYTTGMEHSPTSATGTGRERTPWHATQRGVWEGVERSAVAPIVVAGLLCILRLTASICAENDPVRPFRRVDARGMPGASVQNQHTNWRRS
jgi:hypothetical protein